MVTYVRSLAMHGWCVARARLCVYCGSARMCSDAANMCNIYRTKHVIQLKRKKNVKCNSEVRWAAAAGVHRMPACMPACAVRLRDRWNGTIEQRRRTHCMYGWHIQYRERESHTVFFSSRRHRHTTLTASRSSECRCALILCVIFGSFVRLSLTFAVDIAYARNGIQREINQARVIFFYLIRNHRENVLIASQSGREKVAKGSPFYITNANMRIISFRFILRSISYYYGFFSFVFFFQF